MDSQGSMRLFPETVFKMSEEPVYMYICSLFDLLIEIWQWKSFSVWSKSTANQNKTSKIFLTWCNALSNLTEIISNESEAQLLEYSPKEREIGFFLKPNIEVEGKIVHLVSRSLVNIFYSHFQDSFHVFGPLASNALIASAACINTPHVVILESVLKVRNPSRIISWISPIFCCFATVNGCLYFASHANPNQLLFWNKNRKGHSCLST